MKKLPSRTASPTRVSNSTRTAGTLAARDMAEDIRRREPATLRGLDSIIHHPRSLARPVASWRPPSKLTPRLPGGERVSIAVTRHRVGAVARRRVLDYGSPQAPAYLVSLRVTDPDGEAVSPTAAEAWVRALVGERHVRSVHEVGSGKSLTYVWMTDGTFTPLRSPASLYVGFGAAA